MLKNYALIGCLDVAMGFAPCMSVAPGCQTGTVAEVFARRAPSGQNAVKNNRNPCQHYRTTSKPFNVERKILQPFPHFCGIFFAPSRLPPAKVSDAIFACVLAGAAVKTVWPSGLRRWLKAPVGGPTTGSIPTGGGRGRFGWDVGGR